MTGEAPRLINAAYAVFPEQPDFGDRDTITGYEFVGPDQLTTVPADPAVPDRYWVPDIGDARELAARITVAVLRALADCPVSLDDAFGPNPETEHARLLRIAGEIDWSVSAEGTS